MLMFKISDGTMPTVAGKLTSDGWTGSKVITRHFSNALIYSSVDIRTHSTQSIISDDEVFTGCYSDNSINHGDNISTEDEVWDHVIFTILNNINVVAGC